MSSNYSNEEPNMAPESDRWYNITLGPSFKDHHSSYPSPKFCTLRYEFKPASIDKSQPGSLHKSRDNRVAVEYHNNQHGKPKVTFEAGVMEDCKENDAVLFFDGDNFHLERLHRAVKRLRHVWLPGESAAVTATATATLAAPAVESPLPSVGRAGKSQASNKGIAHQMIQVEQIDVGEYESLGTEPEDENNVEYPSFPPNPSATSPDPKHYASEEHVDIVNNDDDHGTVNKGKALERGFRTGLDIDINLPHQAEADDEIANVDISDDEGDKGPNAAEALRAQVIAEGRKEESSSSSSSSESDSSDSENESASGSRSGSSSSDSETSNGDSVSLSK